MEFKNWLIRKLGGVSENKALLDASDAWHRGFHDGTRQVKLQFAVLPLPFTDSQLLGREYGDFITPAGFGGHFGECTIPAPGQHGYEQRAYYVSRDQLNASQKEVDLVCYRPLKFDNPADSDKLVPVIVTVLR